MKEKKCMGTWVAERKMILYSIREWGVTKREKGENGIEWIYVHTLEAALRKRFITAMPSCVSVTP